MSFGWSAGDIFTLVQVCYKLVENCREGVISASAQVKSLQNDLEEFTLVLSQLFKVVDESKNIAFLDPKDIKQTIRDCNDFLASYKHLQLSTKPPSPDGPSTAANNGAGSSSSNDLLQKLRRRSSFSKRKELLDKSRETGIKLGETLKYVAWGGDDVLAVLQKKLTRHRQTLALYLQILERKRHAEENSRLYDRLYNVEAMVRDLHSERRVSSTASPEIPPASPRRQPSQQRRNSAGYQDYEAIIKALNEQKRIALLETEHADDDDTLQEWNDILSYLEFIHRRVLNAAERTANSTAQRRTGSSSYQISLNRMLNPHHTMGTPPSLRPVNRVDTQDSGFFELPPVREESSGLTEGFVESGYPDKPTVLLPSEVIVENRVPLTPSSLMRTRTLSVNAIERPVLSASSSAESVTAASSNAPPPNSPRHPRTFSMSSSEVSFASAMLHWETVQFNGWVKCHTTNSRKPMLCNMAAGYDSHGQVYALQVQTQSTNSPLVIMKLSTRKKRPIPHIEPPGERDSADEGIPAYFVDALDTEPKEEEVQFFFQDEKSLNKFESVVYGQELLLPIVVEKISSSSEGLSDRQRIRVWKKGDSKSIVFFASKRDKAKRRYLIVHACDVQQPKINKKNCLEFKLEGSHSHHLHDLKIGFKDRTDVDLFTTHFLSE